eukprot:3560442-Rhodomonas_salina.1
MCCTIPNHAWRADARVCDVVRRISLVVPAICFGRTPSVIHVALIQIVNLTIVRDSIAARVAGWERQTVAGADVFR